MSHYYNETIGNRILATSEQLLSIGPRYWKLWPEPYEWALAPKYNQEIVNTCFFYFLLGCSSKSIYSTNFIHSLSCLSSWLVAISCMQNFFHYVSTTHVICLFNIKKPKKIFFYFYNWTKLMLAKLSHNFDYRKRTSGYGHCPTITVSIVCYNYWRKICSAYIYIPTILYRAIFT